MNPEGSGALGLRPLAGWP